jgi:HSP20 family protein
MRENQMLRTQWDPFEDLRSAHDELNQMSPILAHALGLHGQRQGAAIGSTAAWAPALDISERKDAYLITVELPGVALDDVQITMEDSLLTIQGERHFAHDSSEQQFHRVERHYGAFRRSITLPAHVVGDAVQATVDDGVLQIVVPKAEEAKPKRIQVRPGPAEVLAASSEGTTPRSIRSVSSPAIPTPTERPPPVVGTHHSQEERTEVL